MYQEVAIKQLKVSKNNYRKTMDPEAMKGLIASVKANGVLEPILVRTLNGKEKDKFEIVAGHRRYAAATKAKLPKMPCMVHNFTDAEALKIQVIENNQRENPNPMEEAWGFKQLIKMGEATVSTLAAELGHTEKYVLERMRLLNILKEGQKKLVSGNISIGHALVLTRLKHESEQKELLAEMTEHNGMTVKAAQSQMYHYSRKFEDAVFDTAGCEKCPSRTRNQAVLFPHLKRAEDECMNRDCFSTKTKEHCAAIVKKAKAEGFKIITDEKEVDKLTGYDAKSSCQIAAPGTKDITYSTKIPKRYKSECMNCKESHVYYLYIQKPYYGNRETVHSGEICQNLKCLYKMNGLGKVPTVSKGSASTGTSKDNTTQKARECRDRFLLQELPAKVEGSEVLRKRLCIHHLVLEAHREEVRKVFNEASGVKLDGHYVQSREVYKAVAKVPAKDLDAVLKKVITATIIETNTDALLLMTPEAGIDMVKDFSVDEAYLKGKTKGELVKVGKELALGITLTETAKKGALVKSILAQELKGKVPKDISKVCSFKA